MRILLFIALLLTSLTFAMLAPSADARPIVCTDALMPNQCSLEILCVYNPLTGVIVKCVRDPCWNAATC